MLDESHPLPYGTPSELKSHVQRNMKLYRVVPLQLANSIICAKHIATSRLRCAGRLSIYRQQTLEFQNFANAKLVGGLVTEKAKKILPCERGTAPMTCRSLASFHAVSNCKPDDIHRTANLPGRIENAL